MKIANMNLREIVEQNDRAKFISYCRKVLCTQNTVPDTLDGPYDGTLTLGRKGCDDMMWMWIQLFTSTGTYPNKGGRKYNPDYYEEIANNAILGAHWIYDAWWHNRRLNPCYVFDVMDLCGIAYEENVNIYDIAKIVKGVLNITYKNHIPYYAELREFQAQRIVTFYGWMNSGYDGISLSTVINKLMNMLEITNKILRYSNIEYNAFYPTWNELCEAEKNLEKYYQRFLQ